MKANEMESSTAAEFDADETYETVMHEDVENLLIDYYEVEHKVTDMKWKGAILDIEGYCYIKGIPLERYLNVKKWFVLMNDKDKTKKFVLEDIPIYNLSTDDYIQDEYMWAGFKSTINFSAVVANHTKPLPPGTYRTFLEIEATLGNKKKIIRKIPLGDIRRYLQDDFYSSKMEYYSAKSQSVHNLMVTYDKNSKSMLLKSTKLKDFNPSALYGDIKNKTEKPGAIYRFMRTKMFMILYYLFHLFPVRENRILFASDSRDEIGGNLKYVYEEMERQQLPYDYKFMFKENSFVKKSFFEIIRLAYYAATSKATLLEENYPMVSPLKIRKNTDLIQLWHGAGAFKKFGYSRLGQPGGPKINSKDHRNYTKAVVSSKNVVPQYAEGFDILEESILPLGIPRTDIFFDEAYKNEKRKELYDQYPFLKGKKVILFAPTFRGRGRKEAHYPIENLDFEKLYETFKDEYVFLFKLHFIVLNKVIIPHKYAGFFYDFTDYREVNDLLLITDLLITDYSSICFEYSLLDKPMLFFAYDVEEYISKRGFYYEYQSFIPGHLVKDSNQLIEKIQNKDFAQQKVKPFRDYFFDYQDGKASERVVNQLLKKLAD
ncbi:CDP-glycerol glycerophosphotransferase family protein [Mesobacillus foraminis]|uniref:CDP-ribitol ribitolphosphotransferase n=1 Tax=Mesobacillus foraminis TaxID=279826 RepID=A0A4R2BHW4_9BACI|nr:CDP-glycerol glycerophosphotransferase family protein [Mesobacillus foraminis]TCN26707.1 CDP-ribitol ribitolphosphotransferase [Mesobacillus foraminis]